MLNQRLISRLRSTDWDFSGSYSESPFSSIHWQPGRFASQLPASFIGVLTEPGDLILDPFAGSGTALIEAQRLGRPSVGIDLNPISCLAARAKTIDASAATIENDIRAVQADAKNYLEPQQSFNRKSSLRPSVPGSVQAEKWYTNRAVQSLGILWTLIHTYTNRKRLIAEAAFSSILLPVCRETRHWGYVCDNSRPIGDHDRDVLQEFCKVLDRIAVAYRDRDADCAARFPEEATIKRAEVICADSRDALRRLPSQSVRLVITSPPYFGVCDYVKAQRLSFEWFGLEIESLRLNEIGARSKRRRLEAPDDYCRELQEVLSLTRSCLRSDGALVLIVGQSSTRDEVMDEIRLSTKRVGYNMNLDMNRRVTSQRRQAPSVKGKHILVVTPT